MRNTEEAESDLCENLARSWAASQALSHCRNSVRIAEQARRVDSDDVQATEDVAAEYGTLGLALHRAKQLYSAAAWERRADAEFRAALAIDPGASEVAAFRADDLLDLSRIENELHNGMACSHLEQARGLLQKLAAHFLRTPRFQGDCRTPNT
jgi:hypothetical protein